MSSPKTTPFPKQDFSAYLGREVANFFRHGKSSIKLPSLINPSPLRQNLK